MLPSELQELVKIMSTIEELEKRANWQDNAWREELAAAAAALGQIGQKLAESSKQVASLATFVTAGEEAGRAGDLYLDTLKCYENDPVNCPGEHIAAMLCLQRAALLANGGILQQALRDEAAQEKLMKQAALN